MINFPSIFFSVIVASHNLNLVGKFSDFIYEIIEHKLVIKKPLVGIENNITQVDDNISNTKSNNLGFSRLLIKDTLNSIKRKGCLETNGL